MVTPVFAWVRPMPRTQLEEESLALLLNVEPALDVVVENVVFEVLEIVPVTEQPVTVLPVTSGGQVTVASNFAGVAAMNA